jgi:hypothetical protein
MLQVNGGGKSKDRSDGINSEILYTEKVLLNVRYKTQKWNASNEENGIRVVFMPVRTITKGDY